MKNLFELDARLSARLRVAEKPGKRRRLAIIFGHSGDSWFWLLGLLLVVWGLGPAWFGWLLLAWAPLVGLARVATGLHYVSDVLAGWALGLLMGAVTLQVVGIIG